QRLVLERGESGFEALTLLCHLASVGFGRSPSACASEVAEARVEDQIGDAEEHGEDEKPEPPARQRIVVLLEIAVPDVTGLARTGFGRLRSLRCRSAAARHPPHEPQAREDVDRRKDDDEKTG